MLKISLFLGKGPSSWVNDFTVLTIKNPKFQGIFLYEHRHGRFSNLRQCTFKLWREILLLNDTDNFVYINKVNFTKLLITKVIETEIRWTGMSAVIVGRLINRWNLCVCVCVCVCFRKKESQYIDGAVQKFLLRC